MLKRETGITFLAEPRDVEVACGADKVAIFPCQYEGESESVQVQWVINSTVFNLSKTQLPPGHHYIHSTHTLSVTNIKLWQNQTIYQCQLLDTTTSCVYTSTVGQLIIKCKSKSQSLFFTHLNYGKNT